MKIQDSDIVVHLKSKSSHLDDTEAEVSSIKHNDFVLVGAFVKDMAQGEERLCIGEHSAPPGRVALMSDDQVLLVGGDGLEKNRWLIVLIRGREVVLRKSGHKATLRDQG